MAASSNPVDEYLPRLRSNDTTLTTLYLRDNKIGDEGAGQLATALATNSTLTALFLFYNNIGDEGTGRLLTALATKSTLTELYLGETNIDAAGVRLFATALATNSTLTTLYLAGNNIDAAGGQLATALATNSTLTTLYLFNDKIDEEVVGQFATALATNSTLTDLHLNFHHISTPLKNQIVDFLDRAQNQARLKAEKEQARAEQVRCMLGRFNPPSTLVDWITDATSSSSHPLAMCRHDSSLHRSFSEWISTQALLQQSLDQQLQCESDFLVEYSDISSLVDVGANLINPENDEELSVESISSNLQAHIQKLNSIEKQHQPLEIASSSTSSSEAHLLIQRVQVVIPALQQLREEPALRLDQLAAVPLALWTQQLADIFNDEQQPEILSGFEQIRTGIQKSTEQQLEKLAYLECQLDIAHALAQLIPQIDQDTLQKSTLLSETQTSRRQKQQEAIQALRCSISTMASFLAATYQQQLKFVAQDYDDVCRKLKNARSIGLKDVANKLQRRISKIESQMSSIDSKARQVQGTKIQFGTNTDLTAPSSSSSSSLTTPDQQPLLIRVQEKERLLMAEAIHSVERVIEYEAMIDQIRETNRDLKTKLSQSQQELLDILVCPITQEVMVDPVLAADHHTYERQAIELWLRNQNRSPLTNQELPHKQLEPNWLVKNILAKMRELYSIAVPTCEGRTHHH